MKKREIVKLVADSGGRCNYPGCGEKVIFEYEDGTFVKVVEFCHIIGESSRGPRGHPKNSELKKEDPENIILLCANHHKVIDNNEVEYTVESLKQMKLNHTRWVNERLDGLKEAVWTLLLHSGNVTGTGAPKIDNELVFRDFYGTHIIAETEELIFDEFLTKTKNWQEFDILQKAWWRKFKNQDEIPRKFIVCSINFIPLVVQLGYLIHNTNSFEVYHYHPKENTWKWKIIPKNGLNQEFFLIDRLENEDSSITEIALSISISGLINSNDILAVLGRDIKILKIYVDNPDRNWLQYKEQIQEFQKKYTKLIDRIVQKYRNLKKLHLFYAGPTAIGFIIGSFINPTIHPQFILYNFYRKDSPKYSSAFDIN